MKKVLRIMGLCTLVALAATSCKKDEQKLTSSFTAELTQPAGDAKTHLGSDSYLYWDNGDAIKVFDNAGTAYLLSTTDNNVKVATFTSEATLDANESYTAFYPAAATAKQDNEIRLTLPAAQTFAVGSFGNATYPMAATNTGTSFTFHSPCGLLAIPVKGTGNIGTIELTGKASENLAGQLRYNLNGEHQGLTNGQATVTLDCGNIALDATNATTFYFVVPAGVFANGFKVVLKNGTTELYTLETVQDNTIAAETIKLMPVVTVSAVAVTTDPIANVGYTDATVNGSYVAPTGMSVTEVGFYFGADATAMTTKEQATLSTPFSHTFDGLTECTTYYYMAYAKNGENEYTGSVESFTTNTSIVAPTVTTSDVVTNITSTGAVCGGEVTNLGNGTLTAYGISYSTDASMSTSVTIVAGTDYDNGNYIATLTGLTGSTTYYYRAYATNEAGTGVGEVLSFTTPSALPDGIINGLFSVSATQQVYFSKGNLQYIGSAATPYWKFAENQWDYLGSTTGQNSNNQNVDRDLFGWGTSGYNHGAAAFRPWRTSTSNSSYYAYGNQSYHLYDQTGQADWGYNAIVNGGNQENSGWRTLTNAEWGYVFNTREGAASKKGHGNVNGVNGMILLPDEWTLPEGLTFTSGNSSWANVYNVEQWAQMEANGAVFLPAAGTRNGTSLSNVGSYGRYWSSSYNNSNYAYSVRFSSGGLNPQINYDRFNGYSVRLVRPAEN